MHCRNRLRQSVTAAQPVSRDTSCSQDETQVVSIALFSVVLCFLNGAIPGTIAAQQPNRISIVGADPAPQGEDSSWLQDELRPIALASSVETLTPQKPSYVTTPPMPAAAASTSRYASIDPRLRAGYLASVEPITEVDSGSLLENSVLDRFGDHYYQYKTNHEIPVTVGAWHWWHINTGGPSPDGYGIPELSGTHFYYIQAEPSCDVDWGSISKIGGYIDARFRDSGDPRRPFFPDEHAWLNTGFAWALTPAGVFKAGAIWKRFGLDWDGTWWGNTSYFDGLKLDTDWGVAWEWTPIETDGGFKTDSYLQFFFHENSINGSLVGADAESVVGSSEKNTIVWRLVPTWQASADRSVAFGVSALIGQINNDPFVSLARQTGVYSTSGDELVVAWAADVTCVRGPFKAFAEVSQTFGTVSPARYTSGGPSDRLTSMLVGWNYKLGPATLRCKFSAAFDDNPAATHTLVTPGFTLALTQNVELWFDYVRQEIRGNAYRDFIEFEDGIQMVLHWHF